jgi:hypothetical protein
MFIGWFVMPSVQEAGPAGGAVMGGIVKRKLPMILNIASMLSLLAGTRLYMLRFSSEWLMTTNGIILTLGGILAIGAAAEGLGVAGFSDWAGGSRYGPGGARATQGPKAACPR